jgi:hypothetical protein
LVELVANGFEMSELGAERSIEEKHCTIFETMISVKDQTTTIKFLFIASKIGVV